MSKLKRHATFSTGTRPKLPSLASAVGSGGAMRKAVSVDFADVPEIMTTPAPSPSVGRKTPVRSRRPSGNRRHPSGGNGKSRHDSGESTCSTSSYQPHHYNCWLPINPHMPMAGPVHECSVTTADESLRSYDPTDIHLSFAGCGFLGIYHIGVAAAFQHFMPDCHFSKLAGASAGALAAAALVADIPVSKMASVMMELTEEARAHMFGPWNPYFHVTKVLIATMDRILPDDIHVLANGRLHISVTKVMDGSNTIAENFSSKRELINAIAGSAFIPVFSGGVPTRYRGIRVIDGGFSKNILSLGEETITVAPFAGSAMISPIDDEKTRDRDVAQLVLAEQGTNITMQNMKRMGVVLFPPPPEDLAKLLDAGFRDAHRFLRTRGMTACVSCLTVRTRTALVLSQKSDGETESSHDDNEDSEADIEDEHYEDDEAWKKHLPKFQRGMKCEDHVDCDRHNAERLSLPDQIQGVIEKFMSGSEQQLASYRAELTVSQQETLIGTMMRLFFKMMSYSPLVWLGRWGITKTFDVTRFMFKFASEITPLVDYITDQKVIQMAEEIIYTLVARVVGAQSLRIIPSRARGTGARKGYKLSKAKGKHKPLTGHGAGSYRPSRLHRQNVDCDISITHLGGGLDDECTGSPGAEKNASGEGSGLKTSEQEVEWLQVSVNATTDASPDEQNHRRLQRKADIVALKLDKARLDEKFRRFFKSLQGVPPGDQITGDQGTPGGPSRAELLADAEWRRLNTVMEDPDCPLKIYRRYKDLTRFQNPEEYKRRKRRKVVKQFRYNSATRTMIEE